MLFWLTLLAAGLWSVTAAFGQADVESVLARPVVTDLKISPDGKYLAARVFVGDRHVLRVLDVKNFNVVGGLDLRARGGPAEVGSYNWASNRRLVGQLLQSPAGHAAPVDYGELFGVDYDGRKATILLGFRVGQQAGTHIRQKKNRKNNRNVPP